MDVDFPTEDPVALDLATQGQSNGVEGDDLDNMFFEPRLPKLGPVPELVFEDEPSWLVWGHHMIACQNEGLNIPFSKVSGEVWKDLEKEEKTKGRLQWVLTRLKEIGRNVAKKVAERVFESDSDEEEGGPGAEASGEDLESLLECVHRILVTEATIQRSKLKKKHKANPILQMRNLDLIPPRGVLVTMGV
jgi:hypothetical protein